MVQTNFLLPLTLSSKMAERSCFNGSLTIYLLVSLLVAQFLEDPTKLLCRIANLQIQAAVNDSNQPKISEFHTKTRLNDISVI